MKSTSTLITALVALAISHWTSPQLQGANPEPGSDRKARAGSTRPNILFLFADDWGWPHASCLGDPVVKTPTFDRLAREGVLFRNAHSASPSCSPSRAAILTGQMPWRLGDGANLRGSLASRHQVYPDLLGKAGYFVGMTGKGYSPGSNLDRPHNAAGPAFKSFKEFLAKRPKDEPFCFWLGSHHPHRGYIPGCGIKAGLDPNKVVVPPYLPDSPEIRSDICDYYHNVQAFDQEECGTVIAALEHIGELDNTIIVISGDNGWPFPRCKANNYDTGTHQTLAIRWRAHVVGGRTVEDFVSLADLAPTFLEAAGIEIPKEMNARSLMPILRSSASGFIEKTRDHVITGMETHTPGRDLGEGRQGGYPRRSLVTREFHFIRNFFPERWPAGDPMGFEVPGAKPFDLTQLSKQTHTAYSDVDAGPTKAWMLLNRDQPMAQKPFHLAFGKRPERELYDLAKDPYELVNVAGDPAYATRLKELEQKLMTELIAAGDPRATGEDPNRFEKFKSARRGKGEKE